MTKRLVLDDRGDCTAVEAKPGVWHITRISPFGQKNLVILTAETIKYLAGQL